jgi:hypothetical protein
MVIWAMREPVAEGEKVTIIAQFPPDCTVALRQLSVVTLKSPLFSPLMTVSDAGMVRARVPVFSRVTVSVLAVLTGAGVVKASGEGLAITVVKPVSEVHSGVCQTPRPYVAAARTGTDAVSGAALSSTTGAAGNPVPNADQHTGGRFAQLPTCVVK